MHLLQESLLEHLVLFKQQRLEGTAVPAGGNYDFLTSSPPVLNGYGQVAFRADLTGTGVTTANDTALFAGLPGSMMKVVREGDLIDVDPGIGVDSRIVAASGISLLTVVRVERTGVG